ncbi:MAG: AAC(3) family N-acetyltransferase [Magnetococcales bacterium]|nr:AAC(3) family N-acetyltransferase [Magnetococcales bacterium]
MLTRLKHQLKLRHGQVRLALIRRFQGFDVPELQRFLQRMGEGRGRVVMVHCSWDGFTGFTGTPRDLIDVLQHWVGDGGTLLMPTLPFTGLARDWAESGQVFDVRRTPSQTGVVSEMFRRSRGVVRSVHPTHSVAAWGALAAEMIRDHQGCRTPCGQGSPYAKMLEHDGLNLLLGVDIRALTFFHAVEEMIRPWLPFDPFTRETWDLQSRDVAGQSWTTTTHLFDPNWSRRRDLRLIIPDLQARGHYHRHTLHRLEAVLLGCRDVLQTLEELARQGRTCYRDTPDHV